MASVPPDRLLLRPPKSLSDLPIEIFQQIAVQTVTSQAPAAAAGPPKGITNLLLTSKQINSRLSFDSNPSFYGEIFDAQFDTAALKRRFHSSRLTAPCRAAELKRRWICLKRIRQYSRGRQPVWGYPGYPGIYADKDKLQDAWLAFLMLTEDDGLNTLQLSWAQISHWTRSFIQFDVQAVSVKAQQSGQLPVVSELRALGLWLLWMTTKFDEVVHEQVPFLSKVNRMLRPFTFASWAYPSFFAPWQLSHVPPPNTYTPPAAIAPPAPAPASSAPTPVARPTGPPIPRNSRRPHPPSAPQPPATTTPTQPTPPTFFRPNFLPPTIVLPSYLGHPLPLTPPLINHSAALLFFTRMQRFRLGEDSARPEDIEILNVFRKERGMDANFTPRYIKTNFVAGAGSEMWDEDVRRLGEVCRTLKTRAIWKGGHQQQAQGVNAQTMADRMAVDEKKDAAGPSGSGLGRMQATGRPAAAAAASFAGPLPEEEDVKGMKRYRYVPGTFAGEWEGRFVIYGLDAHQNVAQGVPGLQALESTVLTQDPQAWRLREYHHPSILKGKHRAAYEAKHKAPSSAPSIRKPSYTPPSHLRPPIRPAGQPLSGFIPRGLSVTKLHNGGLEVFNPLEAARTGRGSEGVFYSEVTEVGQDKTGEADDDEDGVWDEMEPKEDDLNGRDDVDVIIEGESIQPMYSMDGRQTMMEPGSKVVGTIRRWDGLITLLATPLHANLPQSTSSDSQQQRTPARTQWLYRGYMTANGNWVGRWRDTWNDVTVEGYEGVFVMTKRTSPSSSASEAVGETSTASE